MLVTVLGLHGEWVDVVVTHHPQIETPAQAFTDSPQFGNLVDDLTGGCSWILASHPQAHPHQIVLLVLLVNWDRVAAFCEPSILAMQGTLHMQQVCIWTPVLIANGLCYPLSTWDSNGVVLKNGIFLDEWELGIPASSGDNILWISSDSAPERSGYLGEAPCQLDRWCVDPVISSSFDGACSFQKFGRWMDRHLPCTPHIPDHKSASRVERVLSQTHRVQISLEASLPILPCGDSFHVPIDLGGDAWENAFSEATVELAPLPDGLRLHPATAAAFLASAQSVDVERTELYIDGSANDQHAGWSVVVVQYDRLGAFKFQGCCCGPVLLNESSDHWMGATQVNNISAELQAMCVAQTIALKQRWKHRVTIRPDLQFSHHLAVLRVGAKEDTPIASVVASLGSLLGPDVEVQEVRGHHGNPWNELADCLAKFALQTQAIHGQFPSKAIRFLAANKLQREWLWWKHGTSHHKAAFPPVDERGHWILKPCCRQVECIPELPTEQSQIAQVRCSVASVNVCSIRDGVKGSAQVKGARATRLDQQLHHAGIVVAGVQETRMPQGQRVTNNYSVFASGCQQCDKSVHFGTEIWISRTTPIAHDAAGKPIFLGKEKPTVIHADPRCLILRFNGVVRLTVVAAHAPCLSIHNTSEAVEKWWNDFTALCSVLDDASGLLCCIDANAPLASQTTEFYGMCGAETPNRQTRWFQSFLERTQLFAPSTLGSHVGDHHTWIHPKKMKLRRDFVLVNRSWFPLVFKSHTIQSFDTGLAHVDHAPAVLELAGTVSCKTHSPHSLNKMLVQSPKEQWSFQQAIASLPMPTWDVHVDRHCDYLQNNVMQIARQVFVPKTRRVRDRPQLTESTLNLIHFKRQILQIVRRAPPDDMPLLLVELRAIEKEVRIKVAHDQRCWYDDWVRDIEKSGEIHDHKQVFQKLIRLGRKRSGAPATRPLPMLQRPDGVMARDFAEVQAIFCEQFAELEAGILVDQSTLESTNVQPTPLSADELDVDFIPSVWQMQRMLMRFRNGKAPGKSGITVEVFRAGGLPMIHQFLPLMVKSIVHTHEPLQWKGGRLFSLYKGKGDPSSPKSFRSIFLSELAAKMLHAMVRTRLETCWERQIREIQHGGRKNHSTDTAHHIVQAHMAWARDQQVSSAVVFIDLKAAFYSVFRQSLVSGQWKASDMQFLLTKLDVAADEWAEILRITATDDATGGLNEHVRAMLKDMFTATFFEMTEVPGIVATARGTRPGDPVGDILFNMLFRLILQEVRIEVASMPGVAWIGDPQSADGVVTTGSVPSSGFAEIAFVDDVAYVVHAPTPDCTLCLVQSILSAFKDAAAKRGLCMNFDDGKTEVIMNIVGKGSQAFKRKIWHDMNGRIPVVTEKGVCSVNAVHQYKHLGSFLQEKAISSKDRSCRVTDARKAAGALTRPFFAKHHVSLQTKARVFAALVSSRHLYNVHTWAWVTTDELERWACGLKDLLLKMIRLPAHQADWFQLGTEDLYALAGLDAPMDCLHAARLRYVRRAIKVAPPILWQLLWNTHSAESWLVGLQQSFDWFQHHYPHPHFSFPREMSGWLAMIAVDGSWKGRVKSALAACKQFRIRQAEGKKWTMLMEHRLHRSGCGPAPESVVPGAGWKCGVCEMTFRSKRALAMHASQLHGYKQIAKYYVLDDTCVSCGKHYFSRHRNIRHFQMSAKCSEKIMACFAPAPESAVDAANEADRLIARDMIRQGWRPVKAFRPPLKAPFVELPLPQSEAAKAMLGKWKVRNGEDARGFSLAGQWSNTSPLDDAEMVVQQSPSDDPVSYIINSHGGDQAGEDGLFAMTGPSVSARVLSLESRVFVHFFSGFRRRGDLQHQIEQHAIVGRLHIFCISIDICLAKAHSDLTDSRSLEWWTDRVASGQILGVGGGPSCETWSAARLLPGGPTPIRSFQQPWGLPALSGRMHKQLVIGMQLIHFLVQLLLVAAHMGLSGFLEHPAFPVWAEDRSPSSIWSLEVIKKMCRLHCFQAATFDQCLWGCRARKPTTFLTLRLQFLHKQLLSRGFNGRCNHFTRHAALRGHNYTGNFCTAIAKVYPPALNKAISEAIVQQVLSHKPHQSVAPHLPTIFGPLVSDSFIDSEVVQPDYAPQ